MTFEKDKDIFEHQPGLLTHKILEKIGEDPVTSVSLTYANLEPEVMNETFASFSQLNIPKTGLHELELHTWYTLKERPSETVIE